MMMFVLGIAWLVAAVFVGACTLVWFFHGGIMGMLITVGILWTCWHYGKKDWGFGKYLVKTSGPIARQSVRSLNSTPTSAPQISTLDEPDFGIDPDAMP